MAGRDIRISTALWSHPKILKLERRTGPAGVLALIRLWCWSAEHRPDGVLGSDEEDIVIAAGWTGEKDLVRELLDLGLLNLEGDCYSIHDWDVHQPWVANSTKRSTASKDAASRRWGKRLACGPHAAGIPTACGPHEQRMRSASESDAETPKPDANGMQNTSKLHAPFPIPNPKVSKHGCLQEAILVGHPQETAGAARPCFDKPENQEQETAQESTPLNDPCQTGILIPEAPSNNATAHETKQDHQFEMYDMEDLAIFASCVLMGVGGRPYLPEDDCQRILRWILRERAAWARHATWGDWKKALGLVLQVSERQAAGKVRDAVSLYIALASRSVEPIDRAYQVADRLWDLVAQKDQPPPPPWIVNLVEGAEAKAAGPAVRTVAEVKAALGV
jgi:hypothetical protein